MNLTKRNGKKCIQQQESQVCKHAHGLVHSKAIKLTHIHFQDRSGAAALRFKNRAEISVSFVNRSLIRYGFCVGAPAIRYSVDIA